MKVEVQRAESKEVQGLKDGGHKVISCSSCRKPLVDVWITRPLEDFSQKVIATCPYCQDRSFLETIEGGFHIGGFENKTVIADFVPQEDGTQLIKVLKV